MSQDYLDIKNYSFQKDIGEGNFGKVKLGIFKPTGEEFAIKILNKSKIKIKMKNTIFKENEIITRFNHINVVYVFQILEDSQNYYIIMEYCKHGELFDYIVKHEKLSEEESSIFFYQLINGIEYIHSKGISHRDLKPENLLLAENKVLKIIDFGLSHEFEGDELLKTKCGSPSYAAPEIICCPFYDGFKVDVWCCGIILYAMLCGYLPFEGEDNNILFQNILECEPDLPNFLSNLSKDMILKILNPDPEDRITIDEIKTHKFYLKGKKLCNLDYESIENFIIKRRNRFEKKKIKNLNLCKENKSENYLSENIQKNTEKNFLTINDNKSNKAIKLILHDSNNNNIDNNIHSNQNINSNNVKKSNSLKNLKNNSSSKIIKKTIKEINYKCGKKQDVTGSKIQEILKTDMNTHKNALRPFSSHKNININNYCETINNKNFPIALNNNSNTNNIINNKENKPAFVNLISDNKDNKFNINPLFMKVLESTKNKNFNLFNDKLGFINTKSINLNKNLVQKREDIKNKDCLSFYNNFKNIVPKNNNETKSDYNPIHIISFSNDNINEDEKYQKTFHNKNNHRLNLFKEPINLDKNKENLKFHTKRASSKYKTNSKVNQNNSIHNNSIRENEIKSLNFFVPNSTLYYNNININIKEVNINPKIVKSEKGNMISSFITNPGIKTNSHLKNNINNKFCTTERKNYIENKAFSARRLFSYNINTNNIHNFKSNINKNINFNKNYNNGNLYTISNNINNRHLFINPINFYENNNNKRKNKYKENNFYKLSKNLRFVSSDKNYKLFKNEKIVSTEPKELIKKQISFNKVMTNKNKGNNLINIYDEINNKYMLKNKKRSKTEKNINFNCKTINTEGGRARLKSYNNHADIIKKYNYKKGIHNNFKKYNNIEEKLLNMLMNQKYNIKNNK